MTVVNRQPDAQGNLQRYPFPRLLYYLYKKQLLGELEIHQPSTNIRGRLYFRDGLPVHSTLPFSQDVLGRVLLERGLIDELALNRSLQEMAISGRKQGKILLEMGVLDQKSLIEGLRWQLQRKLNRIFAITEADFWIYRGDHDQGLEGESAHVQADPLWVIYHGVRNSFNSVRMKEELDKLANLEISLPPKFEKVWSRYGMGDEMINLVTILLRGAVPTQQIFAISDIGQTATQMLIYTLWVTEMLTAMPVAQVRVGSAPDEASLDHRTFEEAPIVTSIPFQPNDGSHEISTDREGVYNIPMAPKGTDSIRDMPSNEPEIAPNPETASNNNDLAMGRAQSNDTGAAAKQRNLIRKMYRRLKDENYYEILGVDAYATEDHIRDAYFALAKDYHPDRVASFGLDTIAKEAEEIFRVLNEAHTTLIDRHSRKTYDESLAGEGAKQVAQDICSAEFSFQKGLVHLRKKNFSEALQHFQEAYTLNPKEGEHLAYMAWALFSDPKTNKTAMLPKIKEQLLQSIYISPNSVPCHYFLGEIYLAMGKERRAYACFDKVLEINPDHIEAERHLRLLRMRSQKKKKEKKGLFSRFRKNK
jgi:curved DNA-binding protein CbpA